MPSARATCATSRLAILGYVNNQNVFPPSGRVRRGCDHAHQSDECSEPDPSQSVINQFLPGLPGASRQTAVPMYSWVVPILPYLDNQELYNQWTMFTTTLGGRERGGVAYFDPTNYVAGQASKSRSRNNAHRRLEVPGRQHDPDRPGQPELRGQRRLFALPAIPSAWVGSQSTGRRTDHQLRSSGRRRRTGMARPPSASRRSWA